MVSASSLPFLVLSPGLCSNPFPHFLPGSLKLVTPEGAPAPGLRTPEIPMTEAVEAVGMCWEERASGSGVRVL